jgi:hypothetical protein
VAKGVVVSQLDHRLVVGTDRRDRREQRRLRRALRDQDRVSARLAELYRMDGLLDEAAHIVEHGWLQDGWFAFVDPAGVRRIVVGCTPRITRRIAPEQVVSACLVGAIVYAGGGPSQARSQLVQRSMDLTWHASFRGASEPVRWCPSPVERAGHVMDLVRWNDSPGRTPQQVTALLGRARELGRTEADRVRDLEHAH